MQSRSAQGRVTRNSGQQAASSQGLATAVGSAYPPPQAPAVSDPASFPPQAPVGSQETLASMDVESKKAERPKWQMGKVSKGVTRRRRNHMIKQMIRPRNPIQALQTLAASMKRDSKFSAPEITIHPDEPVRVSVQVFDKVYFGAGRSDGLARENAAENALKSLIVERIPNLVSKATSDTAANKGDNDFEMADANSADKPPSKPEDDIAWGAIAGYAMHKLISDFGIDVNAVTAAARVSNGTSAKDDEATPKKRAPAKQLPANPGSIHPVALISMMKPDALFSAPSGVGTVNVTVDVVIDDVTYHGVGVNKKAAKKDAAEKAATALFNVQYGTELKTESVM